MNVTQISIGRFHHFHLARQLEKNNRLDSIWTGYPRFKLKDEQGIPAEKIHTFPWLQMPYMVRGKVGLNRFEWLNKEWEWLAQHTLDRHVAAHLKSPAIVIALSGMGLYAGTKAQQEGGLYICDRGSSHIRFQDQLLKEEYKRWGYTFKGVDERVIAKEEQEYQQADKITVPSEFVRRSFIEMGVPEHKLAKVMYGARLDRFHKTGNPPANKFRMLWVGGISIRKGFMDMLQAFQTLKHPNKELLVIGNMTPEIQALLAGKNLDGIVFRGNVANQELPAIYSTSHVFVLPSLEEGLAMVQGEALACGCPVIASTNTGSEDLFTNGTEGFVIPVRSPSVLAERLQQMADDEDLRLRMSENALQRVHSLGGWDSYGNTFVELLNKLENRI